jgi:hypothetical protein
MSGNTIIASYPYSVAKPCMKILKNTLNIFSTSCAQNVNKA